MLLAIAALIGASCDTDPGQRSPGTPSRTAAADTVIVEGVLTAEGGACVALRSDRGELYALEDVPAPYDDWERFVDERFLVIAEESGSNRCRPGRNLRVIDMGLVLPPGLKLSGQDAARIVALQTEIGENESPIAAGARVCRCG